RNRRAPASPCSRWRSPGRSPSGSTRCCPAPCPRRRPMAKQRNGALALPRDLAHRLEAVGAALMFGLFRLLPLDAASALGGWLGRLIGPRLGVTKRAAINLRRALPELDEAAARRVM